MPPGERLTIDMTVARDYVCPRRCRHRLALELLELDQRGEVELVIAAQGLHSDVPRPGDLRDRLRKLVEEGDLRPAPQIAEPSDHTHPAVDLFPGHYLEGFDEKWDTVARTWESSDGECPPGANDRWYVKTHLIEGRDLFITDDGALRNMCRRLREEHQQPVIAMGLEDYMARRRRRRDRSQATRPPL